MPYPFADFALYPFDVVNLAVSIDLYSQDCMLTPVSPPSLSSNLRVTLGTPNTEGVTCKAENDCWAWNNVEIMCIRGRESSGVEVCNEEVVECRHFFLLGNYLANISWIFIRHWTRHLGYKDY